MGREQSSTCRRSTRWSWLCRSTVAGPSRSRPSCPSCSHKTTAQEEAGGAGEGAEAGGGGGGAEAGAEGGGVAAGGGAAVGVAAAAAAVVVGSRLNLPWRAAAPATLRSLESGTGDPSRYFRGYIHTHYDNDSLLSNI
jgi:hypothetical protein